MNKPDGDLGFARLFDGFEAEMARRVVVPGADAARRAAYNRGRRNARVMAAVTAVMAAGVGSGVTLTVAGGGPQPLPTTAPSPDTPPSPTVAPTPDREPSSTGSARIGNLSITAPAEFRLTRAPGGGFHGKLTFTVRNDGRNGLVSITTVYELGNDVAVETGVASSGLNTCVFDGGPTTLRCSIEDRFAAGSSLSYDLNLWSGVAATSADQVFTIKLSVRAFDGGAPPLSRDETPENNTATVRVIVPKA